MTKFPTLTITHDDDDETPLPFKWEICGRCDGHGKHCGHLGAITQEQMDDNGPDFFDDYMAGIYDKTCEACEGDGKVAVVDRAKMPKEQLADWDLQCKIDREMRAEEEAERRFGC